MQPARTDNAPDKLDFLCGNKHIPLMKKANILSIEDDPVLQLAISEYLEEDGYAVLTASSAKDVEAHLKKGGADVILLDLNLPDTDGFSLLAKIRSFTKTPVIIVSGKTETTEKVVGLEMGAVDYITKPFEMRELSARIKAVLRRTEEMATEAQKKPGPKPVEEIINFGGWKMDRRQFQVFDREGRSAGLTAGEFRLLEVLVLAPNRALTRDYLYEVTRGDEFGSDDRAVDLQVGRIRKKINDNSKLIKTVRGVGYMYCTEDE
jgi:DNA-binding response OmpR family regulator